MHILIDMQGAQTPFSKNRGVGRYTVEMVRALLKTNANKHKITLLFNASLDDVEHDNLLKSYDTLLDGVNIEYWFSALGDISGISGNQNERCYVETIREWKINQISPDLVWSTNLQEGWFDNAATSVHKLKSNIIYCSTLHDVIPLIYPDVYLTSAIADWYRDKIKYAERSDIILTVSEYSKEKISELTCIPKEKIHVAYNSYNESIFYPINESFEHNEKITNKVNGKKFILYVGGADAHKNLDRLIESYSKLDLSLQDDYALVFAGAAVNEQRSYLLSIAKLFNVSPSNIVFTGAASNEDLAALMRGCAVFIFPSYSEGFGLPPLEAMACGAAVLGANAASIPEIITNASALFDPYNVVQISNKLAECLNNEKMQRSLKESALLSVKKFSWDESALFILNVFENEYGKINEVLTPNGETDLTIDALISHLIKDDDLKEDVNLPSLARIISNNDGAVIARKKIHLDLSCLVHFDHATGIQRVVRAVMDELCKNAPENYDISLVFSYAGHSSFYKATLDDDKFIIPKESELQDYIVDFYPEDILLFLDLHPGSAISKKHTICELRKRKVSVYFIVYDLLPISHPNYFVKELSEEFAEWLKVITLSSGAICISADVAERFSEWVQCNKLCLPYNFKIRHFHLGADLSNSKPSTGMPKDAEDLLVKFSQNDTFLMVGTVEPRKGHALVLDTFEYLWTNGFDGILVIVGREGWRNEETIKRIREHVYLNRRIFWLQGISDEFLEKVYSSSSALIAASEGEGFGLPLIEAAQHKIPIIARDIPVFHEVAGEHAYYFSGINANDLTKSITDWIELYHKNEHPKSNDMPWLTWQQSVETLLKAINII